MKEWELQSWSTNEMARKRKERKEAARWEKRFVILTSHWSDRSNDSSTIRHQFKTRDAAEKYAMLRILKGMPIVGLVEMDVLVGAENRNDEFQIGDFVVSNHKTNKVFKIVGWDNDKTFPWPKLSNGDIHDPNRLRLAHPTEISEMLVNPDGSTG